MNTFGTIKTKIEKASIGLYGKPEFKVYMSQLKTMVLENKDLSELYYIYDDLSKKKGLSNNIATDYINESIEYSQILIENNKRSLKNVDEWISSIVKKSVNNYKDIDVTIYNKSIKNLETVLESKKRIINTIISEDKLKIKESINLPLKTMLRVANDRLNKELSNISESERKELIELSSLSDKSIKLEIDTLKENVISNLKTSLNESKENDLKDTIENTIKKISESKYDKYNLYQLRKLNQGL
jgi:hypothetical protein